jgi:hypothetical protein
MGQRTQWRPGNEGADRLAAEGALLPLVENLDLNASENFTHTGAKLATMTQASLYKGILEQTKKDPRKNGNTNKPRPDKMGSQGSQRQIAHKQSHLEIYQK